MPAEKKYPGIGFWRKESGNLQSHFKGLTQDQVIYLQLKEGERLILFMNDLTKANMPEFTLKKLPPYEAMPVNAKEVKVSDEI